MRTPCTLALLALAPACVIAMDEEHLDNRIGSVVGDCVVPLADRGAPRSLDYPDGSLWIFDDNRTVFVASPAAACAGDLVAGTTPVVELSAAEQADNAERTDGRQLAVQARGGFVDEGIGYLYYDLQLRGPGPLEVDRLGTGLCVLAERDATCARVPDMLWPALGRSWGDSAFVDADGYAYVYGCDHAAAFTDLCGVTRVRPAEAGDPAAYAYDSWPDDWNDDDRDSNTLFENAGAIGVGPLAWTGGYAAVVADIWESDIELRAAATPRGPFGDAVELFDALPPDDWFIGGGRVHPALGAPDGRTIAVSYHTRTADLAELHLVQFHFDRQPPR